MSGSPQILTVHTDGASRSNPGPAACAYVVKLEPSSTLHADSEYLGPRVTNNLAEYLGMLRALSYLVELTMVATTPAVPKIVINSDSQLVVQQINGNWRIKDPELRPLCQECQRHVQTLRSRGREVTIQHIPREENREADRLCNEALDRARSNESYTTA